MAGNPWATAISGTGNTTSTENPWAIATQGGLANRLQAAAQSEDDEAGAAAFANSPTGIAEQMAKDAGSTLWGSVTDAITGLENTYGSVVPQVVSSEQSAAADIAKGNSEDARNGGDADILKGIGKATLGTAGTFAGAVYAPIGAAIGAALQASGGQSLIDSTGQKIADVGGITDLPAFQKFALAHPVAGTYFNQAMNLIMGGADDGKILEASDKVAKAVVDSAGKTITPNPIVKLPVEGDTTPRPLAVTDNPPEETSVTPNKGDGTSVEPIQQQQAPSTLPTIQANDEEPSSAGNETTPVPSSPTAENGTPDPIRTGIPSLERSAPGPLADRGNESSVAPENAPVNAPTKVANDISANLVKEGIAELTPEEKSTYTTGSYKDSAEQGRILQEQDLEALKQMAITGKGIPEGVHPQILFNIVRKLAADTKDYRLQQELARSPLGTERSNLASGLGSSGFNAVKDSPDDVIRDAIDKKAGGTKGKEAITKEATKAKITITKAAKKMMDYQSVIDAIKTC